MSASFTSRPLWRQGMFMRPQHFQQFERFLNARLDERVSSIHPFGWGLRSLVLDEAALQLGKFVIQSCQAVLPDGTIVSIPQESAGTNILTVPQDTRDRLVLLSVPIGVGDGVDVGVDDLRLRYQEESLAVRDVTVINAERQDMAVGIPNIQLYLEGDEPKDHVTMPIAKISEAYTGIVFEKEYIPPVLDLHASRALLNFINEISVLLKSKSKNKEGEVNPVRNLNHTAALIEFMMLQTCNRYIPILDHFSKTNGIHPEDLYRSMMLMAGDFCTFLTSDRWQTDLPPYDHLQLRNSLLPILRVLREAVVNLDSHVAVSLPLQPSKYGIWVSEIIDRTLLDEGRFILAVGADLHPEILRSRAPSQFKIGPIEQIRDLTQLQLPGIRLIPMPVVPREIPYRAEAVYLQLDKSSAFWGQLRNSAAFALHVSGEYPGLRIEFWAIRDMSK